VRVRIYPATADEDKEVFPIFPVLPRAPGTRAGKRKWFAYVAGKEAGK